MPELNGIFRRCLEDVTEGRDAVGPYRYGFALPLGRSNAPSMSKNRERPIPDYAISTHLLLFQCRHFFDSRHGGRLWVVDINTECCGKPRYRITRIPCGAFPKPRNEYTLTHTRHCSFAKPVDKNGRAQLALRYQWDVQLSMKQSRSSFIQRRTFTAPGSRTMMIMIRGLI